ncbi:uncharacterized protein LOC143277326 isoform X3 [Babylonia areolata]|uniref:uncharacterized protein LOC143277326 isoform X3 n=1 Tax=Babylonia areolata TaxID=304850 RepID=UPI003FD1EA7C
MWCLWFSWSSCVFFCCVFHLTYGLRLAGCSGDHDAIELTENQSGQQTRCEDIAQNQQIQWALEISGRVTVIATCNSPNQPCDNINAGILTATRDSTSSTATFVPSAGPGSNGTFKNYDVICRPAGGSGVSCPVDTVYSPSSSEVSCSVTTSTRWTITVSCAVSKAYSALNRYRCDFRQGSSTGTSVGKSTYSSAVSSGYTSGTCTSTFPMPTSPGTYTYTVIVYPGVRSVSASVSVARPNNDPTITCTTQNGYIRENTALECRCTASDLGQPQGRLRVYRDNTHRVSGNYGNSSVQFGESSVSSADNNAVYRCVLDWATSDSEDRKTTFTLNVAYGPTRTDLPDPPVYDLHPTQSNPPLTLTCSAVGVNPGANYSWSGSQCAGITQSTCSFTPTQGDNGDVISCTAVNPITSVGKTSETRTLMIHYPPSSAPVITGYNGQGLYEGNTQTMTCTVHGGNPAVSSVTFTCDSGGQVSGVSSTIQVTASRDDDGRNCTCSAKWKNKSPSWYTLTASVTLQVYFPVTSVQLTLNNQTTLLEVAESQSTDVIFECTADFARPSPHLVLSDDQGREVARLTGGSSDVTGQRSVMTHTMRNARCENSAVYTCTADNEVGRPVNSSATLRVLCDMRVVSDSFDSQEDGVPVLDGSKGQGELHFQILTTDTPHTASFLYLGSHPTGAGYPPTLGLFSVTCEQTSVAFRSSCVLRTSNVTQDWAGYYNVTMATQTQAVSFTFRLQMQKASTSAPTTDNSGQCSVGFGAGVGVGLTVMIVVDIGITVCLWRRQWRLPCAAKPLPRPKVEERAVGVETVELELSANASDDAANNTGPYEELKPIDIGLKSVYSAMSPPPHTSGTEGAYENAT